MSTNIEILQNEKKPKSTHIDLFNQKQVTTLRKLSRKDGISPEIHSKLCLLLFNHSFRNNTEKKIGKNVINKLKKYKETNKNMFVKSNGIIGIEEQICSILLQPIPKSKSNNNTWKYLYNLWKPLTASGIHWKQVVEIIRISAKKYKINVLLDAELLLNSKGNSLGTHVTICPSKELILFTKGKCA